ncbi:type II secretion system F family protein [Geothrix sp. PMB-07]|uniref:type II secretion system F family protein n=1 Tax=Geothrix sp. PMB-07 TaxID=3068640 RepID=UPI002740B495|nr:type II secretion system F family protein [Geothrix sp. PMB-07]WLT30606.1 type II secretion system F family protein [Geothrix sp. PMB-07]
MPAYAWKGKNRMGEVQEGVLVSDSRDAAAATLKRNGIEVVNIRILAAEGGKSFGKVPAKALAIFTRQFSVMIDAGLPLVQCLEILGGQQDHKGFQRIIESVRDDVEKGSTLQTALSKHPKAFNDLYVNMVGAGESGGILDIILQRLSGYIEKAVKLTAKVKGAMTYPIAVITIAITVVVIIMVKVIPVFSAMYEGMGAKLPYPTLICMGISNALINYSWLIVIVVALIVVGLRQYYKTPAGQLQIDGILLKLPILGDVLRKVAVARFCRTLGTLISSGVPILEGMDITARTAGNMVIQNAILKSKDAVEQGRNISAPLSETKVFPPMVVQMVGVGEATGALDAMLAKVADFYEDEVDNAVANLTSLMEPAMIGMLGGIIGFIVVAMYMPIFNMANVMGKD